MIVPVMPIILTIVELAILMGGVLLLPGYSQRLLILKLFLHIESFEIRISQWLLVLLYLYV